MTQLPPSQRVVPNIPLGKLTTPELRAERDYWDQKIENATGWGAAVGFADSQRRLCDRLIETRMAAGVLS